MDDVAFSPSALPYLTFDLPGTCGAIKCYNEDFLVEEVPLYEASGEGSHSYVTIEKKGLPTMVAIRMLARALGRRSQEFGYAGLKDAHGVTRQVISIEHVPPQRIRSLSFSRIEVLSVQKHTNKLKLGHLKENRFELKIRGARPAALDFARPIIEVLCARGVPNYFGPQRFGARGDNGAIGLSVMKGDYEEAIAIMLGRPTDADKGPVRLARALFDEGNLEEAGKAWPAAFSQQQGKVCRIYRQSKGNASKAWRGVDPFMRRLYISAFQSELFNRVLAARIASLDQLMTGDVAWKHANGAAFVVEDAAKEQPRCDQFEISPTGPLFGPRMLEARGIAGEQERVAWASYGLTDKQRDAMGGTRLRGGRRPMRVPLRDFGMEQGTDGRGAFLQTSFVLPPGSYATCVTREIVKF